MRNGHLREKREGCKLGHVNLFEFFDHTTFSKEAVTSSEDTFVEIAKALVNDTAPKLSRH
jgi:hypothetical protein